MADLTAADVSVTRHERGPIPGFGHISRVTVVFGDGAKKYPALGVPMPADRQLFGMLREVYAIPPVIKGGLVYVYEPGATDKVRIYQTAGFTPAGTVAAPVFTGNALALHNHDLKVMGGAAAGIDEPVGVEGGDTLAKDAATDRTISGADSATKGGVVGAGAGTPAGTNSAPAFTGTAVAAGALAELGNVVVAATSLTFLVFGK